MSLYYDGGDVRLFHGDALEVARTLPDESVQTIVTSPPYFGLRDYGEDGQIGMEDSPAEYVESRPCILAGSRHGDTVLDPFSGSGTTGAVATFEGRNYIGIDLNREYLDLSLRTRFQQPALPWGGGAA